MSLAIRVGSQLFSLATSWCSEMFRKPSLSIIGVKTALTKAIRAKMRKGAPRSPPHDTPSCSQNLGYTPGSPCSSSCSSERPSSPTPLTACNTAVFNLRRTGSSVASLMTIENQASQTAACCWTNTYTHASMITSSAPSGSLP